MRRRSSYAIVAVFVASVAAGVIAGWPADRYRHNDFIGFWLGSRALLEGADPYDTATWLALHRREGSDGLAIVPPATGFGYPLTAAVVFAPFALLPITVAAPLWLATQVALALAALAALGRRLFPATLRRDLPVLVALAACSQPAWVLAEGGNLGGFELAVPAFAIALLLDRRPLVAGAVAGLVVVKPHLFLIALPLLLLALPRATALRAATGAAASAGAILAVSLVLRPSWVAEWLVSLGRIASAPVGRATVFGLFPPSLRTYAWAVMLVLALGCAWWIRSERPSLPFAAAVVLPLSLFAAPYGWSYDHTILLVTVAVAITAAAPLADAPRAKVLALLAVSIVALAWVLYALAFSRGEESWSALVPVAALAVLLVVTRQRAAVWHDALTV